MRHFQNTFAIELQFRRQGVTIDGRDVGKSPRSSGAKDNAKSSDNAINLQGGNNDYDSVIYPFSNITL